jgi:hypothetical protein
LLRFTFLLFFMKSQPFRESSVIHIFIIYRRFQGGFLVPSGSRLRAHERISSQSLGVEAPAWQGAKVQEYLDIPSFRNAARRDASADKM